ncbi:hypothetical protein HMP0721_0523 [Pseudoramibacter alactolyticus ATCC 23263]|uniref:Uncharacterized protein n=1 Tax=Pseudoramibacter alactolyticus ATCC 23263 TaxID=887929 RepID=E6MEU0_9FIRM|nr:hypothetical protein HMP0721_0523 [Pseudoramibacter alactolyticus ATCC 23263]
MCEAILNGHFVIGVENARRINYNKSIWRNELINFYNKEILQ